MGNWKHRCNGHWHSSRPHNWVVVGATQAFDALSDESDSTYVKSPASKHRLQLTFPQDPEDLPTGAIITSVTYVVRANRTTSKPRPLYVEIAASDKPSRYISRCIYPSQTIGDIEVGTYKKDPRGKSWDIHRLNKLIVSLKSSHAVSDCLRVYDLYAQVNYKVRPTVTVDAPSGTVQTASPKIEWTYLHEEGDAQLSSTVRLFTAAEATKANFDPDTAPRVHSEETLGDIESLTLPISINPDTYHAYVKVKSVHHGESEWASRSFVVTSPVPSPPGNDNAGVAGLPGIGSISVVPNGFESSSKLTMRESSNLLSVNQADFEQNDDPIGFHSLTNCTVSQVSTVFYESSGSQSMQLNSSASGQMIAKSTYFEIAPSAPVTIRGQLKAGSTGRGSSVRLRIFDESFTQLQEITTGNTTTSTSTWTELVTTGTTNSGAVYGQFLVVVDSTGASNEKHYADHLGVMYGTNSAWSHGGHTSRNLLTSSLSTGQDPAGTTVWSSVNNSTTLSRPTAAGTGNEGGKMNRMTYSAGAASIALRATGTVFSSPTSGTDFTLNKPAGVVDNDLMIAFVTANESGAVMTPPTGWTAVNATAINDGSTDTALWILKRTGLTADPSTWTDGSLSIPTARRRAVVVAYSGAANASTQFLAQGVNTDSVGNLTHTTATVNNTDSNAWRICAFAYNDDTSCTTIANVAPPSTAANISYVGSAEWNGQSTSTSFTINRPSGVANGDLLIASVAVSADVTINTPSGWTLVRSTVQDSGGGGGGGTDNVCRMAIFKRSAGSSEPTSWSGTTSSSTVTRVTGCVAYRNTETAANQFIAENSSVDESGSSITTASITNTDSRAWRICAFAGNHNFGESTSSTEVSERMDDSTDRSGEWDISLALYDSNGTVSTGSHSRQGTFSASSHASVAWIGLIKPLASAPAPGANETERTDGVTGSSSPFLHLAVYDSNATVATGTSSVTAQITTGSGTSISSSASWIGLIKPATDSGGTLETKTSVSIDISELDPEVLELCANKLTLLGSFMGNAGGVPTFRASFYRANQLISTSSAEGNGFGTSAFSRAHATFDIPPDTTGIQMHVAVNDRANSDTVDFIRMGMNLGTSTVYSDGTARSFHPVWSAPELQYAEDAGAGYGDWQALPGQKIYRPQFVDLDGSLTYFDHTVTPLLKRKYRVQTKSFGRKGDVAASGYGPSSEEAVLEAQYWWLKDLADRTLNLSLDVSKLNSLSVGTTNTATVFHPLGEDYPVIVTEGFKSEIFTISVFIRRENYAKLVQLLKSNRSLFLQSNIDNAWWVRPVGDIQSDTLITSKVHEDPIREVKIQFVQIKPEE